MRISFEQELDGFLSELKTREYPPYFDDDRISQIEEFIKRKQPFEYPERYIAKHIKGMDEFKRIIALASISCFKPIHVIAIGDPACFPEGSLIPTRYSFVPIESIARGDQILSQSGGFQKVLDIHSRQFSGELIWIKPFYFPRIYVTPNHPIFVKCFRTRWIGGKWIESNDLINLFNKSTRDARVYYLVVPKPRWKESEHVLPLYQTKKRRPCNPNQVVLDNDLAELFGWYVAEGYADPIKAHVQFNLGSHETDIADRLSKIIEEKMGLESEIAEIPNSSIRLTFYSRPIATFFKNNFGADALVKKIPSFIMEATQDKCMSFIRGLFCGDGYRYTMKNRKHSNDYWVLKTASKQLALQTQLLLLKLRQLASLHHYKRSQWESTKWRKTCHDFYVLSWCLNPTDRGEFCKEDEQNFYVPIRASGKIKYNGMVYNLETEDGTIPLPWITHNSGKSEIAQSFAEITPRVRFCWGSKLTAAGLTLARLGNRLMVGVLPACHMGMAIIDEFNWIPVTDASAVLATMAQQWFSIDKAFLKVPYIPSKLSVIGMANPRGDYFLSSAPHQIRRQIPFHSLALLTRFNLIFIILRPEVGEFEEISDHQLKYRMGKKEIAFDERERELWRDAVLYLRYIDVNWTHNRAFKRRLIAAFTTEAYRQDRKGKLAIPISPRLNEGVSNLSEAYARANMRNEVWTRDVIKAIFLIARTLVPCGLDMNSVKDRIAKVVREYA